MIFNLFFCLLFFKDAINRPRRECRPGKYQQFPWTQQGPTTILPNKRGARTKPKKSTSTIPKFNLEELPVDEDDDIAIVGYGVSSPLRFDNVDPNKVIPKIFYVYEHEVYI